MEEAVKRAKDFLTWLVHRANATVLRKADWKSLWYLSLQR
jgi:hypothetical protein